MNTEDAITAFSEANNPAPPHRLGQRYNPGCFLPEAGNTVVRHLDFDASAHGAVLEARRRMHALPGADRFLQTPETSLHMTVFEGIIETRRASDAWPTGLPLDAPVETVTKTLMERFSEFRAPPDFAVRVEGLRPTGLVLTGATAEDEAVMRTWRETLTRPFGFRHREHNDYRFHMTFAYPLDWIPEAALPHWIRECELILRDLTQAAPVIPLRPPAFCRFADMTRFEELVVLKNRG